MNTFIGAVGVILFIGGFVLMALKKSSIVNFRGYVPMIVASVFFAIFFIYFLLASKSFFFSSAVRLA